VTPLQKYKTLTQTFSQITDPFPSIICNQNFWKTNACQLLKHLHLFGEFQSHHLFGEFQSAYRTGFSIETALKLF